MHNKALAALIASLLVLMTVPAGSASSGETVSDHYDATLGVRVLHGQPVNEGLSLSWTPAGDCSGDEADGLEDFVSEVTGEPLPDVPDVGCQGPGPNIGGGQLVTTEGDVYNNVIVTAQDDNFDNSYVTACVIVQTDDDVIDNICDDDGNDFEASGCGGVDLDTPGPAFGGDNDVTMFISTVVIDPDTTETCFASSGDLVGVFS